MKQTEAEAITFLWNKFFKCRPIEDNNSKELQIRGYPLSYPAIVCFSHGYDGNIFIRVDVVHVKRLLGIIKST